MATPTPFEQELLPWWCPKVRARPRNAPHTCSAATTHFLLPSLLRLHTFRLAQELEEDVAQCKTRLSLNILIVLSTVPLIVNALIPRRRVARALFPMWYHILWMLRIVRWPRSCELPLFSTGC